MKKFLLAAAVAAFCFISAAHAQNASGKPLSIRIAWPAGGAVDATFRQIQSSLQESLGRPVVIDNLPGLGGALGAMNVASAPPENAVVLGTSGPDLVLAPLSIATAKYSPDSFKLVAPLGATDFILVSAPKHSFRNVDELVAYLREPGHPQLSMGNIGYGSSGHIAAADFEARIGVKLMAVPYKGTTAMVPDLVGSQIDLAFLPIVGPVVGLLKAGKLKAIGIASEQRNPTLPDVPTVSEGSSLKSFNHSVWSGLFVSTRVPDAEVARLNRATAEALSKPEFLRFVRENASRPLGPLDAQQSATFYRDEVAKIRAVAKSINLQAQ
ncbi:MAG TPA: tripartite tricarboxylate transporter substrate binding protein [Ramlibacter sp.]|nr:tripartite tricarboxylate transporter substrate binding protein [Ramlibacter sp.]